MPSACSPQTLLLAICFALLATRATAQTVYNNGPINGTTDAWTINQGFVISDSFTISTGTSTLNGLSFGVWVTPGDVVQSVGVLITSQPMGGMIYFNQQIGLAQSGCSGNQFGFNVCTETGSFSGPTLANGTYWLNLQNAIESDGEPVYWDENSGIGCHSQGCPSQACYGNCEGTIPSEAFTLLGTPSGTGTVPEPESLLLFASGFLGVAGLLRRKIF
jgi:PEP-CTERM motif